MDKQNVLFEPDDMAKLHNREFDYLPVSIFNENKGEAMAVKKYWRKLYNVQSDLFDIGRNAKRPPLVWADKYCKGDFNHGMSIFSEPLCQFLISAFFEPGEGRVLDPFAGGPTRGLITEFNGYDYLGVDLSQRQIDYNNQIIDRAIQLGYLRKRPQYVVGDSLEELDKIPGEFDYLLTCPPYHDLEVYSDHDKDLSNMPVEIFAESYREIIKKAAKLVNKRMIFVVGNTSKCNLYIETVNACQESGFSLKSECIRMSPIGLKAIGLNILKRVKNVVKIHEYCLVFEKKQKNREA